MCPARMQRDTVTTETVQAEVVTQGRGLAVAVVVVMTTSAERHLDRAVLDVIHDAEAVLVIDILARKIVVAILVVAAVETETETEIDEEVEVVVATDTDRANEIQAESDADKHLL